VHILEVIVKKYLTSAAPLYIAAFKEEYSAAIVVNNPQPIKKAGVKHAAIVVLRYAHSSSNFRT
jgi:hypothetical protein